MKTATTTLILCVGILLGLGMVTLYSASMGKAGAHFLMMQSSWSVAGLAVCLCAALLDYKWLKQWAWVLYALTAVSLILVLIPGVGTWKNGSRRWFSFGIANFQPSEAAKLALIVVLAWYGERFQKDIRTFIKGLVHPGIIAGLILAPIFFEPDRGTTILLGGITGFMLLLAGVRWIYFIPPALLGAAGMVWVLLTDSMRLNRILSWLHPDAHKEKVGYQAWQAMIALGSGGVSGLGLGNGRQKLGFVPENHTDFILSIIGEEMGLVATLAVVLAFVIFVLCGVYIAWHARDVFGLLLGSGITFLIGMQAFVNIGVVTSALPNKGLPLPFVSYGGSSLTLMLFAVGVLISIARKAGPQGLEEEDFGDLREAQLA